MTLSQRIQPIGQQSDARWARLLGMELGRGERAVLDRRQERRAVGGPCQVRWGEWRLRRQGPMLCSIGVEKIKRFGSDSSKKSGVGSGRNRVPPHVRKNRCGQERHLARPLTEAGGIHSTFHSPVEEHLHSDAYAQNRSGADHASFDDRARADLGEGFDDGRERADPGNDQSICSSGCVSIGRESDSGSCQFQCLRCGMHVARAIVQQRHGRADRGQSDPFVEGMPITRASGSIAVRSARAKALNSASAM